MKDQTVKPNGGTRVDATGPTSLPPTPEQMQAMIAHAVAQAVAAMAAPTPATPATANKVATPPAPPAPLTDAELATIGQSRASYDALPSATQSTLLAMVRRHRNNPSGKLTCKVSPEKHCLCVYGLGIRPWSGYLSQWERVISYIKSGEMEAFIEANRAELEKAVKA